MVAGKTTLVRIKSLLRLLKITLLSVNLLICSLGRTIGSDGLV